MVYVLGGSGCGSGGCPTLVFAAGDVVYRRVATIGLTHPPIRASATRSEGWRNLIVGVGGGDEPRREIELGFDGESYPRNPTVPK